MVIARWYPGSGAPASDRAFADLGPDVSPQLASDFWEHKTIKKFHDVRYPGGEVWMQLAYSPKDEPEPHLVQAANPHVPRLKGGVALYAVAMYKGQEHYFERFADYGRVYEAANADLLVKEWSGQGTHAHIPWKNAGVAQLMGEATQSALAKEHYYGDGTPTTQMDQSWP